MNTLNDIACAGYCLALTACFRIQITSTIPKRDNTFVQSVTVYKQHHATAPPVLVSYFTEVGTNEKLHGAFLGLSPGRRPAPTKQIVLSDKNGRVVNSIAPGRYHVRGLMLGFRPAETGILTLAAGDSVVIKYRLQVDPTPLY